MMVDCWHKCLFLTATTRVQAVLPAVTGPATWVHTNRCHNPFSAAARRHVLLTLLIDLSATCAYHGRIPTAVWCVGIECIEIMQQIYSGAAASHRANIFANMSVGSMQNT